MWLVGRCGVQSSSSALQTAVLPLTLLRIPAVGPALLPQTLEFLQLCKARLIRAWERHYWHLNYTNRNTSHLWFLQPCACSPNRDHSESHMLPFLRGPGFCLHALSPWVTRAASSTVSCEDFDFPLQLLPEVLAWSYRIWAPTPFLWSSVWKDFITISLSPLIPWKGTAFLAFLSQHCSCSETTFLLISYCFFPTS